MKQAVHYVTQSKYYTPAFNAAIYDGPIRIYFAQYQEAQALKVYFQMQERLSEMYQRAKDAFKQNGLNIFVMLYPTPETFEMSFQEKSNEVALDRLGEDYVMGVKGPIAESHMEKVYSEMEAIVRSW